jgi:hypothetical protein
MGNNGSDNSLSIGMNPEWGARGFDGAMTMLALLVLDSNISVGR